MRVYANANARTCTYTCTYNLFIAHTKISKRKIAASAILARTLGMTLGSRLGRILGMTLGKILRMILEGILGKMLLRTLGRVLHWCENIKFKINH